jgi:hypothetical protein
MATWPGIGRCHRRERARARPVPENPRRALHHFCAPVVFRAPLRFRQGALFVCGQLCTRDLFRGPCGVDHDEWGEVCKGRWMEGTDSRFTPMSGVNREQRTERGHACGVDHKPGPKEHLCRQRFGGRIRAPLPTQTLGRSHVPTCGLSGMARRLPPRPPPFLCFRARKLERGAHPDLNPPAYPPSVPVTVMDCFFRMMWRVMSSSAS